MEFKVRNVNYGRKHANFGVGLECSVEGGMRRCGGQGDVLAGTLATFRAWLQTDISVYPTFASSDEQVLPKNLLAAYGACSLTRTASKKAFNKHLRSTTTPAIIEELSASFRETFETTPIM